MFPLFSKIVLFCAYVTNMYFIFAVVFPPYFVNSLRRCLLSSRICLPSLSLFLFFTSVLSFLCLSQSFFLLHTSLLSHCLSLVHCISSILSDCVCLFCRSLSFTC